MNETKNAGAFTVTKGLYKGNEYVYVTHRGSGKQWMSKNEASSGSDLSLIATNIELGITKFRPQEIVATCDARFWIPIKSGI